MHFCLAPYTALERSKLERFRSTVHGTVKAVQKGDIGKSFLDLLVNYDADNLPPLQRAFTLCTSNADKEQPSSQGEPSNSKKPAANISGSDSGSGTDEQPAVDEEQHEEHQQASVSEKVTVICKSPGKEDVVVTDRRLYMEDLDLVKVGPLGPGMSVIITTTQPGIVVTVTSQES